MPPIRTPRSISHVPVDFPNGASGEIPVLGEQRKIPKAKTPVFVIDVATGREMRFNYPHLALPDITRIADDGDKDAIKIIASHEHVDGVEDLISRLKKVRKLSKVEVTDSPRGKVRTLFFASI